MAIQSQHSDVENPKIYKSKAANAQEAHEPIRPTDIRNKPEDTDGLNQDQQNLYNLIWQRTVASQLQNSRYLRKTILIEDNDIDKVVIETLRFKDLIKKHSITEIEKIIIDVEGFEYEILSDIDLAEIKINSIMFEYKHFDGYLKSGDKLQEIIKKFEKNNYKVSKIDKENILAIKH